MTCPTQIYPQLSPLGAWRQAASAMANGVGNIPYSYPLLGNLMKQYRKFSTSDFLPQDEHKIFIDSSFELDRPAVLENMCARYGLEEFQIEETCQVIDEASFPCMYPLGACKTLLFDYI